MKRLHLILLTLVLAMGFTACKARDAGTNPNDNANLKGSLESILDKIYETANIDESFGDFIKDGLQITEITEENAAYFLGSDDIDFEEAIASEPMISAIAYSLCLVRVKEGSDIERIKAGIKENADPRKWICVGVDPKNVIVDNAGDVIILIMDDNAADALHDAFLKLKTK